MLPRADLTTTRAPATIEAPAPVAPGANARQEVLDRLTRIAIGQQLHAEVLSVFEDGAFLVRVADTAARMVLPAGTKVGDHLSMVFIAKEPRPTFLLTEGGSVSASLSIAGRLADQLARQAQSEGTPAAVQSRTPVLLSPAMMQPETIATALHESVEFSGLFYESHMHEWISGSRPLAALQREPQARLPASSTLPPQEPPRIDWAKLATGMKEAGDGPNALMTLIREAHIQGANAPAVDAAVIGQPQHPLPEIAPEAAQIIHQQLNALEHQQVQWTGELWPGQRMEWEITEDKQHRRSREAPQSSWSSKMRFSLPTLGEISAVVRLTGDRVQVQIDTSNDAIADTLRAQSTTLADALSAAGSPMDSFLVKRHDAP